MEVTRTVLLRLVAAVSALAVLLATAGCARAQTVLPPGPDLVGVQMHPLWTGVSPQLAARELDVAKRAGADVVRIDIGWSTLEQHGKWRWSPDYTRRLDIFLRNAHARGIKVIGTLMETPCWAARAPARLKQGCAGQWWLRGVSRYPPRTARDYRDAAVYVARRWGRRLTALEIWNEPNVPAFLRSRDRVRDYARLVRATYRPVKRVAPGLTVLAGSMLRSDGNFLTQLYERGRIGGHYDAISYHPYTGGRDPWTPEDERGPLYSFPRGTAWLHDVMTSHGDPDGELWGTEAGASTCMSLPGCVSEQTQAQQVAAYIVASRQFPYVRAMVIYNLRDKGTNAFDGEQRYGLLRHNFSPKPSLAAFRVAAAQN